MVNCFYKMYSNTAVTEQMFRPAHYSQTEIEDNKMIIKKLMYKIGFIFEFIPGTLFT